MEKNQNIVSDVLTALRQLEPDVVRRNEYMNKRDRYVYGQGLWEDLDIEGWFAEYNYLQRVVDIHTAQLMGRPYNVYSYYNKKDLSVYEDNPEEMKLAELENKKLKANADLRKKVLDGIRRDNGQEAMDKNGARIGSVYGETWYKQWADWKDKQVRRVLIESPQNLYVGWQNDNFREFDFVAHVHQISVDSAYRLYRDKLPEGELFLTSKEGDPLGAVANNKTNDPIDQMSGSNGKEGETDRQMVTVIDLVGYLPEWGANGDKAIKKVKRGDEDRVAIVIVGGHVVQTETREKYLPKFYRAANRVQPRRAFGASDLPQSALDINKEIVQLEADARRWMEKHLYSLIQAKGFTPEGIPRKKARKQQVIAMSPEQSLEEMRISPAPLSELRGLVESKIESFVRVTNIGRVLFDDPSIEANSAQALMTTMKPVIDTVEDKQSRWDQMISEMDTDALYLAAAMIPDLKEAIVEDEGWFLCIEWPSVLRREDSSYQSMWLNRVTQGLISLETYMEKMGDDYSEEIDRLRDEMRDETAAAVMGRQLPMMAQNMLMPQPMIDPAAAAGQAPGQIINPDQNTEMTQPVSVPGSGQPPVSPEGAVAQQLQNSGA